MIHTGVFAAILLMATTIWAQAQAQGLICINPSDARYTIDGNYFLTAKGQLCQLRPQPVRKSLSITGLYATLLSMASSFLSQPISLNYRGGLSNNLWQIDVRKHLEYNIAVPEYLPANDQKVSSEALGDYLIPETVDVGLSVALLQSLQQLNTFEQQVSVKHAASTIIEQYRLYLVITEQKVRIVIIPPDSLTKQERVESTHDVLNALLYSFSQELFLRQDNDWNDRSAPESPDILLASSGGDDGDDGGGDDKDFLQIYIAPDFPSEAPFNIDKAILDHLLKKKLKRLNRVIRKWFNAKQTGHGTLARILQDRIMVISADLEHLSAMIMAALKISQPLPNPMTATDPADGITIKTLAPVFSEHQIPIRQMPQTGAGDDKQPAKDEPEKKEPAKRDKPEKKKFYFENKDSERPGDDDRRKDPGLSEKEKIDNEIWFCRMCQAPSSEISSLVPPEFLEFLENPDKYTEFNKLVCPGLLEYLQNDITLNNEIRRTIEEFDKASFHCFPCLLCTAEKHYVNSVIKSGRVLDLRDCSYRCKVELFLEISARKHETGNQTLKLILFLAAQLPVKNTPLEDIIKKLTVIISLWQKDKNAIRTRKELIQLYFKSAKLEKQPEEYRKYMHMIFNGILCMKPVKSMVPMLDCLTHKDQCGYDEVQASLVASSHGGFYEAFMARASLSSRTRLKPVKAGAFEAITHTEQEGIDTLMGQHGESLCSERKPQLHSGSGQKCMVNSHEGEMCLTPKHENEHSGCGSRIFIEKESPEKRLTTAAASATAISEFFPGKPWISIHSKPLQSNLDPKATEFFPKCLPLPFPGTLASNLPPEALAFLPVQHRPEQRPEHRNAQYSKENFTRKRKKKPGNKKKAATRGCSESTPGKPLDALLSKLNPDTQEFSSEFPLLPQAADSRVPAIDREASGHSYKQALLKAKIINSPQPEPQQTAEDNDQLTETAATPSIAGAPKFDSESQLLLQAETATNRPKINREGSDSPYEHALLTSDDQPADTPVTASTSYTPVSCSESIPGKPLDALLSKPNPDTSEFGSGFPLPPQAEGSRVPVIDREASDHSYKQALLKAKIIGSRQPWPQQTAEDNDRLTETPVTAGTPYTPFTSNPALQRPYKQALLTPAAASATNTQEIRKAYVVPVKRNITRQAVWNAIICHSLEALSLAEEYHLKNRGDDHALNLYCRALYNFGEMRTGIEILDARLKGKKFSNHTPQLVASYGKFLSFAGRAEEASKAFASAVHMYQQKALTIPRHLAIDHAKCLLKASQTKKAISFIQEQLTVCTLPFDKQVFERFLCGMLKTKLSALTPNQQVPQASKPLKTVALTYLRSIDVAVHNDKSKQGVQLLSQFKDQFQNNLSVDRLQNDYFNFLIRYAEILVLRAEGKYEQQIFEACKHIDSMYKYLRKYKGKPLPTKSSLLNHLEAVVEHTCVKTATFTGNLALTILDQWFEELAELNCSPLTLTNKAAKTFSYVYLYKHLPDKAWEVLSKARVQDTFLIRSARVIIDLNISFHQGFMRERLEKAVLELTKRWPNENSAYIITGRYYLLKAVHEAKMDQDPTESIQKGIDIISKRVELIDSSRAHSVIGHLYSLQGQTETSKHHHQQARVLEPYKKFIDEHKEPLLPTWPIDKLEASWKATVLFRDPLDDPQIAEVDLLRNICSQEDLEDLEEDDF